jgi:hypothetical protein
LHCPELKYFVPALRLSTTASQTQGAIATRPVVEPRARAADGSEGPAQAPCRHGRAGARTAHVLVRSSPRPRRQLQSAGPPLRQLINKYSVHHKPLNHIARRPSPSRYSPIGPRAPTETELGEAKRRKNARHPCPGALRIVHTRARELELAVQGCVRVVLFSYLFPRAKLPPFPLTIQNQPSCTATASHVFWRSHTDDTAAGTVEYGELASSFICLPAREHHWLS